MKKIIICIVALTSISSFAKCVNPSSLDIEVCAEVIESAEGIVIKSISPNLQAK